MHAGTCGQGGDSATIGYVAHVSEDGSRVESVAKHLEEVAEMAAEFARPFGAESWAYNAGIVHDLGKYSREFQDRILRGGPRVDHSTAGAKCAYDAGFYLVSHCIAGHHAGLPDAGSRLDGAEDGTLWGRLKKAEKGRLPKVFAPAVQFDHSPLRLAAPPKTPNDAFCLAFLVRMVFSCLVDADFLCTERFMRGCERSRLASEAVDVLRDRLEAHVAGFYPPRTSLNARRCGLLEACREAARAPHGVFSLTAPTGAGKTLAMMRFALTHACEQDNGMRRVIVVEPYTSIIDQVADVYRDVFGEENVLEHHSNFDFNDLDDDASGDGNGGLGARLRLASENWEAPIVVTTSVQLFESLFAKSTSRCRKLHNIAGSVIILDEAQGLPTEVLRPCVRALAELVRNYGCSIVLCSATQPELDKFFLEEGLEVTSITSDDFVRAPEFERVCYRGLGSVESETLAEMLAADRQALCVVNSRRQARRIYDILTGSADFDDGSLFHLSTLMYPDHRRRVLEEVRDRLRHPDATCIVVATNLVEAGVDLDFPVVYRAVSGLDSIVQAAGRCNREGRRPAEESPVWVFSLVGEGRVPQEVETRAGITRAIVPELSFEGQDLALADPEILASFFNELHHLSEGQGLDERHVLDLLEGVLDTDVRIQFAEIARRFRLIDQSSVPVIVPTQEISAEVEELRRGHASRGTMRRLSRFGAAVYERDLRDLYRDGAVECVDGTFVLLDGSRYREDVGLDLRADGEGGVFL